MRCCFKKNRVIEFYKPDHEKCRQMILKGIKMGPEKDAPFEGKCIQLCWTMEYRCGTQKQCEYDISKYIKAFNNSHVHKNVVTCPSSHRICNDGVHIPKYLNELGYIYIGAIKDDECYYFQWKLETPPEEHKERI